MLIDNQSCASLAVARKGLECVSPGVLCICRCNKRRVQPNSTDCRRLRTMLLSCQLRSVSVPRSVERYLCTRSDWLGRGRCTTSRVAGGRMEDREDIRKSTIGGKTRQERDLRTIGNRITRNLCQKNYYASLQSLIQPLYPLMSPCRRR